MLCCMGKSVYLWKYISFSDLLLKSGSSSLALFREGTTSRSALCTHSVYLPEDHIKKPWNSQHGCQVLGTIILHYSTYAASHCLLMLAYPQWKQGLTNARCPAINVSYASEWQSRGLVNKSMYTKDIWFFGWQWLDYKTLILCSSGMGEEEDNHLPCALTPHLLESNSKGSGDVGYLLDVGSLPSQ